MSETEDTIPNTQANAATCEAQIDQAEPKPSRTVTAEEEYKKLMDLRSGGTYVPPAKLTYILEKINFEKGSKERQAMEWEKLKKNINGLVNKANKSNLKSIVVDLFKLNLIRGKGLLVKSVMKAQSQALPFTPLYASLVSVLNSKLPQIGELLISRLVLQFKKAYKRNNKLLCISSTTFLSQLCNQQVVHEVLILQILHLLLNNATDDSVDIAVSILKNTGLLLTEVSNSALSAIFEKLRYVLQEGKVEKRTQYMIEVLFQIRRDGYTDYPVIPVELDLVDEQDIITHKVSLDDKLKADDTLNVFKYDEDFEANENEYAKIRREILGEEEEEEEEYGETGDEYEIVEEEEEDEGQVEKKVEVAPVIEIKDMTETNLTNFRKTIYLILKGSMSADEAVHKLLKLKVKDQDMNNVVDMIVKACSQENTYSKYYGVTGEKLCGQNRFWAQSFSEIFKENYINIHRYEPNPLRNISKFWGHLLSSDALRWEVLDVIKLTETDTSSAGRIFIKFIFQELVEELGIPHLKERLSEDYIQPFLKGLFPSEDADHIRFSINYFTAIGLGTLTDGMRESLQILQKMKEEEEERGRSRSPSYSRSSSYSRSPSYSRSRSYSRSPPRRNYSRSRSFSRSPNRETRPVSRAPSRSPRDSYPRNRSRSPVRSPGRDDERCYSRSPSHYARSSDNSDRLRYSDYDNNDYNEHDKYRRRGHDRPGGYRGRGDYNRDYNRGRYRGNSDRHYEPSRNN